MLTSWNIFHFIRKHWRKKRMIFQTRFTDIRQMRVVQLVFYATPKMRVPRLWTDVESVACVARSGVTSGVRSETASLRRTAV